jgi:energy-coupling factor transport system permease protein
MSTQPRNSQPRNTRPRNTQPALGRPADRARPSIARVNPVAKLGAAVVLTVCLLVSLDLVTPLVALLLELMLLPWAGLGWRALWLRTAPLWIAAPITGATTALYGVDAGALLWNFGAGTVTQGSLLLGLVIALRVLAIGIPAIVLFATTDPTDLADGLAQILHLPARFVLGGLAGLRLAGLFVDDWRALALARRARGVGDSGRIRRFGGQAFALLVLSVRRGSKLATAMEARGFGAPIVRTWARPSRFGWREVALVLVAVAIGAAAIVISVATGSWRYVLA